MQEFATNGYVSDDFNRLQYSNTSSSSTSSPPSPQLPRCQFPGIAGGTAMAAAPTVPPAASLAAAHWINLNQYREQLNYVWRSMSALPYIPNVINNAGGLGMTSGGSQKNLNTLGLTMQPEQQVRSPSNANIMNSNNNINTKSSKRYVNGKSGKELVSFQSCLSSLQSYMATPFNYRYLAIVFSVKITMNPKPSLIVIRCATRMVVFYVPSCAPMFALFVALQGTRRIPLNTAQRNPS